MTDLIDRDELKERLKWGWVNGKFVLRTIDEMPTAGTWISTKDRLPEKEGQYLCWAHINKIGCNYQILLWRDNCWYWVHDVLYWLPLPEPPKEEDDAD